MRGRKVARTHFSILALVVLLVTLLIPAVANAGTLDDAVTNVKVRALLLDKLGVDALGIHIEVDRGQVKLTGKVEKKSTQELAKEVTLSVKGVHQVDNQIMVGPSKSTKAVDKAKSELKDAVLEARVKGRLLDQVGANAMKVEVEASNGVVSLRGTVSSDSVRSTALKTTEATKGVKKVVDLIDVKDSD